jgi:glycosyltransferase involved in cell wall biosynthesis
MSSASPLRILTCTSYGPATPLTGGRLRRDAIFAALEARGHAVDRVHTTGRPGVRSASSAARISLTRDFRERAGRADVVLLGDVFCLPMMPVLRRVGRPVVVDLVDSPYRLVGAAPRGTLAERTSAALQSAQLLPVMQGLLPLASAVTYISQEDLDVDGARVARLPKVTIVPNGIHAGLFDLPLETPPAEGYLAWLADWNYPPNRESFTWFVEQVAPALPDDVLGRVRLFGSGNPLARAQEDGAAWSRVRALVSHAGFVESLLDVYRGARGLIAPVVRGAGVNNKVLEPLAAGRPVVTTVIGSRGLPPAIAEHLRVGSTAEEFAAEVRALLAGPATVEDSRRARASVQSLSWEAAGERMEAALLRARDLHRSGRAAGRSADRELAHLSA